MCLLAFFELYVLVTLRSSKSNYKHCFVFDCLNYAQYLPYQYGFLENLTNEITWQLAISEHVDLVETYQGQVCKLMTEI